MSKDVSILTEGFSIVGDVFCKGEVEVCGGKISNGKVIAKKINIQSNGLLECDVYTENLIMSNGGKIVGNITAKNLKLLNGSEISGDVVYNNLSIEDGAMIAGKFVKIDSDKMTDMLENVKTGMLDKENKDN